MLNKILKMFFVKIKDEKSSKTITIKRRADKCLEGERKPENKSNVKEVETCLSGYFASRRGLNLVERGFTYSLMKNSSNR